MKRLRSNECRLTNHFKFLEEEDTQTKHSQDSRNKLRIMFTNIRYLTYNKCMAIGSDHGFMKCDMILLCETHSYLKINPDTTTMPSQHIIKNYETVFKTGTHIDCKSSHGQMCFVKKDTISNRLMKNIQAPAQNLTNALLLNGHTGLIENRQRLNDMWEYNVYNYQVDSLTQNELKIMCLYKHPTMNKNDFIIEFKNFLRKQLQLNTSKSQDVIIIGDFNIDFNERPALLESLNTEFGLYALFDKQVTHEYVNSGHGFSQLDWCITNLSPNHWNINGLVYETWFTDHFPIMLEIEKLDVNQQTY